MQSAGTTKLMHVHIILTYVYDYYIHTLYIAIRATLPQRNEILILFYFLLILLYTNQTNDRRCTETKCAFELCCVHRAYSLFYGCVWFFRWEKTNLF